MNYGFNDEKEKVEIYSKSEISPLFVTEKISLENIPVTAYQVKAFTFDVAKTGYKFIGVVGFKVPDSDFDVIGVTPLFSQSQALLVARHTKSDTVQVNADIYCLFVKV